MVHSSHARGGMLEFIEDDDGRSTWSSLYPPIQIRGGMIDVHTFKQKKRAQGGRASLHYAALMFSLLLEAPGSGQWRKALSVQPPRSSGF